MKRILIVLVVITFAILMTSCGSYRGSICPACGLRQTSFTNCPICGMRVCESCTDPCYYYESGEMENYLRDQGKLVFSDWNEALAAVVDLDIDWVAECVADNGYTVIKDG